jgi:hypothetical protein
MERSRGELRAGSKRSFDDYDSEDGRRLEVRLREHLEHGDLRRQREREADRDWNRARLPERHRGEGYRREADRRYAAGPSYSQGIAARKKVGVRKFSAKSRAAATASADPTPPPPPRPAPQPPSAAHSSHSIPVEPQ